jgi:hypothetical protein
MKTLALLLIALAPAMAQYASSANPNAGGTEMNGKPNFQTVSGAPTSLNCTAGKDLAFDTSGVQWYVCTVTGTPGTWVKVVVPTVGGDLTGSLPNPTIASNAVTSAKMAVVNTRRTCIILIGADNGSALGTTDIAPQTSQCYVPYAAHVVEIMTNGDGTSTGAVVVASRSPANSVTDMSASLATPGSGSNRACANPAGSGTALDGTTTCTVAFTGSATIALTAGSWIETHTSASSGSAKRLTIAVTYTVD